MPHQNQPRESDLELVVSLSGDDVDTIDVALMQQIESQWLAASDVVVRAHHALQAKYPSVPQTFFSYRLRKLVAYDKVKADGAATRELAYQVRSAEDVA